MNLKTPAVVLAFFLFIAPVFATEAPYAVDDVGKRLVPIEAVPNACAWPMLTDLPDGTIVAVLFGKPSHGQTAGEIECWASEDGGKTWSKRGNPAPHDPGTNRMNHAFGKAKNGDLVVLCSGWSNRYPEGSKGRAFRANTLVPWVSRSSDGGRTWKVDKSQFGPESMTLPDGKPLGIVIPFGPISAGADGKLHASAYFSKYMKEAPASKTHQTRKPDYALFFTSGDDGQTWEKPVFINKKPVRNETATFHLGNGEWLAAARGNGLGLYRSTDDGKTWEFQEDVTGRSQHPGPSDATSRRASAADLRQPRRPSHRRPFQQGRRQDMERSDGVDRLQQGRRISGECPAERRKGRHRVLFQPAALCDAGGDLGAVGEGGTGDLGLGIWVGRKDEG